jgi:hypothetical protein
VSFSRRFVLQSATVALASAATSLAQTPARAAGAVPSVAVALGSAGFVPTSRIDPRSYLKAGQTWTTVACIRPAMQAAIDEAHLRAQNDPAAIVEVVIPPGVGRLTTRSKKAPINRSSQLNPRGIYDTRIGFGLRANLQGRIVFRGSGGRTRASVIRLSDEARNLFWIDTDTGVDWIDVSARESSGLRAQRPAKPLMLRNMLFEGFGVDNNNTVGNCHIVCGTVPSATMPQRYVSIQNVHATDIDVWGVKQATSAADQEARNKAPFVFTARHFSDYEGNGGPGAGRASGHAWRNWNLATVDGRAAAHKAGWTWMHAMSFDRVRATNTNRGIIVVGEVHRHFSHWVDDITMTACEHRQDRPYINGTVQQTSFFVGGSCQGGSTEIVDCVSVNVGDDAVEVGGLQNTRISGLTSVNACLAGVYIRSSQRPLDWSTMKVVVEDSTFLVDGRAIQPSQDAYFRSVPIDVLFDEDAAAVALGELQVNDSTTIVDGIDTSGVLSTRGVLDKTIRKQRYGWFLTGAVVKASYSRSTAILRNVGLLSTSKDRAYRMIMWHAQQRIPAALGVTPSIAITDCSAKVSNVWSKGAYGELVAVAAHSTGSSVTTRFHLDVENCGAVIKRADLARIGWLHPNMAAAPSTRHVLDTISGDMIASTAKTPKAVVMYDAQRVGASGVHDVAYVAWGAPKAVDTSSSTSNASRLTVS